MPLLLSQIPDYLSNPQVAALVRLRAAQWRSSEDRIPVDGAHRVARWSGNPAALRPVLSLFSAEGGEFLYDPYLRDQKRRRAEIHASRSEAARAAAKARWETEVLDASRTEQAAMLDAQRIEHVAHARCERESSLTPNLLFSGSDPEVLPDSDVANRAREATGPAGFAEFWRAYPRKVAKPRAMKAWLKQAKHRPAIEAVLFKLEQLKRSQEWTKDGGQFVPYPEKWINRHGWEDEPGPEGAPEESMSYDEKYRRMSERGLR